ncbi:membrane-spanning 4-domains subfamily A member 13 [Saccopteryx leptura]|uniref:membrane-spanning 4-domains subfamily A member 13 n=1 Tax=Saccopteryx leptura TaxID=249018 RepID=UPI00339CC1F0
MAGCVCSRISTANALVFGAIQILIGIYHLFMWFLILTLYMGQIKGVFGKYEPITYKTGCALWGIVFIISGISLIKIARFSTQSMVICALTLNIICIVISVVATFLTVFELSQFHSVSYRNYGQAKLGREVARTLLLSYPLEIVIALTYTIFGCVDLPGDPVELRGPNCRGVHAGLFTQRPNPPPTQSHYRPQLQRRPEA